MGAVRASPQLDIDAGTGTVFIDGHPARLREQERAVLDVLLQTRGRVIGRAELARRAGISAASPRRCDVIMCHLRRTLGEGAIRTVRGRGWILTERLQRDQS